MAEEPGVWEVRLGMFATRQQAEEVKEQITRLLCPDPDHAPPCPIPWSAMLLEGSDLDDSDGSDGSDGSGAYEELVEQARIEGRTTR